MPNTSFCFNAFRKATKTFLSPDEANNIFERVKGKQRDEIAKELRQTNFIGENAIANQAHAESVIKDILEEQDRILANNKRHALLNIQARRQVQNFKAGFKNEIDGLHAYNDGIVSGQKNSSNSMALEAKSQEATWQNVLQQALLKNDAQAIFLDKNYEEDIERESIAPGYSKNKQVQAIAKAINDINQNALKQLRKYGAETGELQDYLTRHSHDVMKMRSATGNFAKDLSLRFKLLAQHKNWRVAQNVFDNMAYERWANTVRPLMDQDRTFADVEPGQEEKFLRSFFDATTTQIRLSKEEDRGFDPNLPMKKSANFAGKLGAQRKLHFKPGSFVKYNNQYGTGSLASAIVKSIEGNARNLALIKRWGTNPVSMFEQITKEIEQNLGRNEKDINKKVSLNKIRSQLNQQRNIFDHLTGQNQIPVDFLMAQIGRAIRFEEVISKLGGIFFSSFSDFVNDSAVMRNNGINLFTGYTRAFEGIVKNGIVSNEKKQLISDMGTYARYVSNVMGSSAHTIDMPTGMMSKIMLKYWKWTGQDFMDGVHRKTLGVVLGKNLADVRGSKFADLDPKLKHTFGLYGFDEKEWNLIRQGSVKDVEGTSYITPDSAQFWDREAVANYLGKSEKELSDEEFQDTKDDFEKRMRGYFIDQTDQANLEAGATERQFFYRGTRPGTALGELTRFFAQFKTWNASFMRRVLGRAIVGNDKTDWVGLTNIVIGATVAGYIGRTAKQLIFGVQPEDPTESAETFTKVMAASVVQGGGLGIAGDFLFGQSSRMGQDALVTLLGPAAGTLDDVVKFVNAINPFSGSEQYDTKGHRIADMFFHLLSNNAPFLNIAYLKLAMNYLFLWGIQDWIAPGSLAQMQLRLKRDQNTTLLVNPQNNFLSNLSR